MQEQGDTAVSGRGSDGEGGAKADSGAAYGKDVRGGGARLNSFPALKTYAVSAKGQHRSVARPGTGGTKLHSSGAKVRLEPNSEEVQGSSSNSCSAALSSVDNFSYDEGSGTSKAVAPCSDGGTKSGTDTIVDDYLSSIDKAVTLYNDSQGIGSKGQRAQDAVTGNEIGSEEIARIGAAASKEPACGVVPRVPPSADLGGGSQEPGKGQGYEYIALSCSSGRHRYSTKSEVGDFAAELVELQRFDGLVEFFRRLDDQPVDMHGTVHHDPSGSGILAKILSSALEEVSKQQLIALAVQGEAKLKRRCPTADAIVAIVVAAENAWSGEKALHNRRPESRGLYYRALVGGGTASPPMNPDKVRGVRSRRLAGALPECSVTQVGSKEEDITSIDSHQNEDFNLEYEKRRIGVAEQATAPRRQGRGGQF